MTKITHYETGAILYEDDSPSMKVTLQRAVMNGCDLKGADLRFSNLTNACLDDAQLSCVKFDYANLTGANLSGADLSGASCFGVTFYNCCLSESLLQHVDLREAVFGATDIHLTAFDGAKFSTSSALDMDWRSADIMKSPAYWLSPEGQIASFTQPPIIIRGTPYPLTFFDEVICIGHEIVPGIRLYENGIISQKHLNKLEILTELRGSINQLLSAAIISDHHNSM